MNDEQRRIDKALMEAAWFDVWRENGRRLVRVDYFRKGWQAARSEHIENRDDDLTVAYMIGFEKGKEEIQEAVEIIKELDDHEGAEGWSDYLPPRIEAFISKHGGSDE